MAIPMKTPPIFLFLPEGNKILNITERVFTKRTLHCACANISRRTYNVR